MTRLPRVFNGIARLVVAVALGCGLAACASSIPPAHRASPPSSTTTSVLPPAIDTATVTINGHQYPVPTEAGPHPISPGTDNGQQIVLTTKGFLPFHLFANNATPIVWTNLTPHPVKIWFEYSPVKSKWIPTGGTFTFSSKTNYSFVYRSTNGYYGQVDIGAFNH